MRGQVVLSLLLLAGCGGRQSVLNPAGTDAVALADLFWVMLAGAVVLWLLVAALFLYVTTFNLGELSPRLAEWLIVGGGIVFPTVLLGGLLLWSLPLMSAQRAPGDGLEVAITGEQWWWRIEYRPEDGDPVTSANELRLPAGQRTELRLGAARVIHSFWVPALGGKTDMFPGRETRMSLEPLEPGIYRAQCAEFCGASHALMALEVVVMAPDAFDAWLAAEAGDAAVPDTAQAQAGAEVFAREGCGACHAVRGTGAVGQVGPDLTHLGSRHSLAAGILTVTPDNIAHFVAHTEEVKPGNAMPAYDHLPEADLLALGHYLSGLE